VVVLAADGSFQLDLSYFAFQHSVTNTYGRKFVELFGPAREAEGVFYTNPADASGEFDPAYAEQCQY